jgi:hypothetical protein
MLGQHFGSPLSAGGLDPSWGAATVGVCALATCWLAARHLPRVPPVLLGMIAATGLHQLLLSHGGEALWGRSLGLPQLPTFEPGLLVQAVSGVFTSMDFKTSTLLALYSVTLALLCSMDTLITTSIIDGRLLRQRDALPRVAQKERIRFRPDRGRRPSELESRMRRRRQEITVRPPQFCNLALTRHVLWVLLLE